MAIVRILLTLLLAFALAKLVGINSYAQDSRAQTNASGALDTIQQVYANG